MKFLNIKSYTCNYTHRKVSVMPPKTLINILAGSEQTLGMVAGIYKSKPKMLDGRYEYTYLIQKLA